MNEIPDMYVWKAQPVAMLQKPNQLRGRSQLGAFQQARNCLGGGTLPKDVLSLRKAKVNLPELGELLLYRSKPVWLHHVCHWNQYASYFLSLLAAKDSICSLAAFSRDDPR